MVRCRTCGTSQSLSMTSTKCSFCTTQRECKHLFIKQYRYWRVELRDSQNYLGWMFVILERHIEDLSKVTSNEWRELKVIISALTKTLTGLFNPDKFNYVSLGNEVNHVHMQVIPRYQKPVAVNGIQFDDKNWGKNYSPYDKLFSIPKETQVTIVKMIKKALQS